MLTQVGPPNTYPDLTSGRPLIAFKIIIITIFVFKLTWVNNQLHSWLVSCLKLIPESDFKIKIITTFILTLNRVNSSLDQWPGLCHGLTSGLSFKTIIIIIFFITYLSWTILELKVFYNDILWLKNNKYYLLKISPLHTS
jgi:hypothetical protein